MSQISELMNILNGYFFWNKARMACFSKMLLALLTVKTVNLKELACAFNSQANNASRYKRIGRFFSSFTIDFDTIAVFIVQLFGFNKTNYYLTLDRTNWQWGRKNINILMLGIVYRGIAIPILQDFIRSKR